MSIAADFQAADDTVKVALCVVGVWILYQIYQEFTGGNGDANDPTNPYVGPGGPGGFLGGTTNVINNALGGLPQSIGDALGQLGGSSYDPNGGDTEPDGP